MTARLEPSVGNNMVLTEKGGNGKSLNIFLLNCTDYKKGRRKKIAAGIQTLLKSAHRLWNMYTIYTGRQAIFRRDASLPV